MFNFMKLAENQPFTRSVSDCSRRQPSMEFTARNILTSSPNNRYLQWLIALKRSLINTLKRKGLKTHPCGTPERTSKGDEKVCKMRREDCRLFKVTAQPVQVTV
jgi:hypothetical protein